MKRISVEIRFWKYVNKTDHCWLWIGGLRNGYGIINEGGKFGNAKYAHRISWQIHNGVIPDGMDILHRCDNPPCVNPKHLFVGTHQDNMRDAKIKGRFINNGNIFNFTKNKVIA